MVRVDRLYLGPMFAPDQLGRDKLPATLGTSGDKLIDNTEYALF
jgi:hypothetical protein